MGAGRKYGNGSKEDRPRCGGLEREGWARSSDGRVSSGRRGRGSWRGRRRGDFEAAAAAVVQGQWRLGDGVIAKMDRR